MTDDPTRSLKARLAAGEACLGAWLTVPSPQVAEAMAACGFDWLAVDMEHGTSSVADAELAFIAAERHGAAPLARLTAADPYLARRLLDAGAAGLIVPVVEDAGAFREFARHCLYPPRGRRGVGLGRFNRWGDRFKDYLGNFAPVLVPMIETAAGVAAADALAALDEVDGLFLGPYDLSASLGKGGDFEAAGFRAAMATVRDACERHRKAAGIHQVAPVLDELEARLAEGFRFVAFGTDVIAIRHALAPMRDARAQARDRRGAAS